MKVLWISDSIHIYSGFGTQSNAILRHFAKSHDVLELGWFCFVEMDYEGIPIKPLGNNYGDAKDLKNYYKEFQPDVVVSLGDIQMVEKLIYDMEDYIFRTKWIHWLPVDGEPYPEVFDEHLQNIEHLVAISDFGHEVLSTRITRRLHKIYHGIDKELYKPLPNKEIIKAKAGLHNRFTCLMVAQNQWRKNIPSMIDAFSRFAKDKKNVDLIIHTKPTSVDGAQGWNLAEVIQQHRMEGKVRISFESYTPIRMNRLYNCANLLVSSTQGEGFGLPHVEAMFAGVPLLLPDYTTSCEQVLPEKDESRRCGELVKIASFTTQSGVHVKRAIIDVDDCAAKLQMFYEDWLAGEPKLKHFGKIGRLNAVRRYDIDKITRQWDTLIHDVVRWQHERILQSTDIPVSLKEIST